MGSLNEMEPLNDDTTTLSSEQPPPKLMDVEELRRQGHMVVDFIADYYKSIEKHPVRSQVEPGYLRKRLPETAPLEPEPMEAILKDVEAHIVPGLTHWMSPNYFAYYPNSGSVAGFVGEILSTGFNVCGFNWVSSPAATELESVVMDWLGDVLKLPKAFLFSGGGGGVLQGTTCEAILCTLVAARDRALDRIGSGSIGRLSVYCSDQTHSAFRKAAQIAGLDMRNFRVLETHKGSWFSMSPELLREAVEADVAAGLHPTFVLATVGTTSTSSVDPLGPIGRVAGEYGMWVHVDAAYAGSACICPEFRHFIDGVEGVTSFSFNAHKWFFTQLDCCCLWVRDVKSLVRSLSTDPEYLRNKPTDSRRVVDYKDWQIPLSRRFRALKLWLVLRTYGVSGLRAMLRYHVETAKTFEGLVKSDQRFEVVVPRNFSMVCFRISPAAVPKEARVRVNINDVNERLMDAINGSGRASVTHSVVERVYFIRFVVGATLTEESHVLEVWKVVKDLSVKVLATFLQH